jgi:hypothetical protein
MTIVKFNKLLFSMMIAILPIGLLFGCGTQDDQEPDPTEEPTEQQQQDEMQEDVEEDIQGEMNENDQ